MRINKSIIFVFIISLFFLIECLNPDSEDKIQNISYFIKCECDTSLNLNILDTMQIQTNSAIIPANWTYSTLSSGIIDSIDHYYGNNIDTGSYEENWIFLTKLSGSEILKFEFKSNIDSTIYKIFEIAIDVK